MLSGDTGATQARFKTSSRDLNPSGTKMTTRVTTACASQRRNKVLAFLIPFCITKGHRMKRNMAASAVLLLLLAGTVQSRLLPQKSSTAAAVTPAAFANKGMQDKITFFRQLPVGPKLDSNFYSG